MRFCHTLLATLASIPLLYGCVVECTLVACLDETLITLVDTDGEPVTNFIATVTIDATTYVYDCSDEEDPYPEPDTDSRLAPARADCSYGTLTIPFHGDLRGPIDITIETPEGIGFQETIQPNYDVNENFGGKGCGTCITAEELITVE